jgi:hypothetical protein
MDSDIIIVFEHNRCIDIDYYGLVLIKGAGLSLQKANEF